MCHTSHLGGRRRCIGCYNKLSSVIAGGQTKEKKIILIGLSDPCPIADFLLEEVSSRNRSGIVWSTRRIAETYYLLWSYVAMEEGRRENLWVLITCCTCVGHTSDGRLYTGKSRFWCLETEVVDSSSMISLWRLSPKCFFYVCALAFHPHSTGSQIRFPPHRPCR